MLAVPGAKLNEIPLVKFQRPQQFSEDAILAVLAVYILSMLKKIYRHHN